MPPGEAKRLATLDGYGAMSTSEEGEFHNLVALAAEFCGTPISLISLVGSSRQWFVAEMGAGISETPREFSFCAHNLEGNEVLVVPNALRDERFADNPLVIGEPHVRFYAGAPLVAPDGSVLGSLCVMDRVERELTDGQVRALRVLARQAMTQLELRRDLRKLHAREARYRSLFDDSPQPMFAYDLETLRFLAANEAAVARYGYSREEFLEMTILDIRPAEDASRLLKNVAEVTEGLSHAGLWRHRTKDGHVIHVEITSHTTDFEGRRAEIVLVNDVTARLAAEDALRQNSESQTAILNALPAHIALLDADGVILAVNESWRRFGLSNSLQSSDFCIGQNYLSVCDAAAGDSADEAREIAARLRDVLAGRLPGFSVEYPCHAPEAMYWFRMMATPLHEHRREGAVVMHVNVTERKLAEMKLNRLNRLHRVLGRAGEAIVRIQDREELLEAVCRIVVGEGRMRMAFICEISEGEVRPAASCGEGLEYLRYLTGGGPLGTALLTGSHDVCNDIARDPRREPWRERALRHGFRSTAAFPLTTGGTTVGVLVLFSGESGYFEDDEVELLVSVAAEVSFALGSLERERQRLATEEALRTSEANMAIAQRIAHIGSWEIDLAHPDERDPSRLRWSDEMYRIAGYEPGSVRVTSEFFFSLVPEEERQEIREKVAAALRERGTYSTEHRLIRPNGEERVIREAAELFLDPKSGKPLKMIGTAHDITERRQREQALRASERQFSRAFEYAPIGVALVSPGGCIIRANRALSQMLGYTGEELAGMAFREITAPGDVAANDRNLRRLLEGSIETYGLEKRYIHKTGREVPALLSVSLVRDEAGRPLHFISQIQDTTERKKLEQQFLRAQRIESIGTLAGGIAHDLNNVLAPIIMSIDLLRSHVSSAAGLEILDAVGKSARRGADMVGHVLTFARGVEGRSEEIDVSLVIHELVRILRDALPKNIRIEWTAGPELWLFKGDPTQIHQVLLNLCVNARDAMPDGGRILIRAENVAIDDHYAAMNLEAATGPYLKIEVEDNGHGVPAEIIHMLFDPFFTTKEVGKGTGLGLSTSLAIIKSHGGFVRVYSEPGEGTRFRIYLPAISGSGVPAAAAPLAVLPRGHGETVLVVDDDAAIRSVTRQTLEAFGYRVILAEDGAEAIGIFEDRRGSIALVLTDMMMPVMDGPTLIGRLRKIDPSLPIIGASGIDSHGTAAGAGMIRFLPKPYAAATLLGAIRDVLVGLE